MLDGDCRSRKRKILHPYGNVLTLFCISKKQYDSVFANDYFLIFALLILKILST